MNDDHLLRAVLDPAGVRTYRLLLADGPLTCDDIGERLGEVNAEDPVADVVQRLADLGFVLPDEVGYRFEAVPLPAALTLAAAQEEAEITDRMRMVGRLRARAVKILSDEYEAADDVSPLIEIVPLAGNPQWYTHQLARTARDTFERIVPNLDLDTEVSLAPSAVHRTLYSTDHRSQDDDAITRIQRQQLRGVEVRLSPGLPGHVVVADWSTAFVQLNDEHGIILRGSHLLYCVSTLFGALWDRAIPLDIGVRSGTEPPGSADWRIDDDDAAMLRLLAAGLKDQAIARHLGIGLRTVVRRIGNLSRALDAETRFQAGLQAARRGLL